MSKLIDNIFDVEKISGEIKTILNDLAGMEKEISGYADSFKNLMGEVRKTKGIEELSAASGKLNDNFTAGKSAIKSWQDEVTKLNEKTKQLTDTEKLGNIEIAKARIELAAAQKETKAAALAQIELDSANKTLTGSYRELEKDLKNAIDSFKNLSEAERNSAKGKELNKKITETQTSLKSMDASMGNFQRNVGDYANQLKGLTPQLGGVAGALLGVFQGAGAASSGLADMGQTAPTGLAKVSAGFKGLGQMASSVFKMLLANPILSIIAGIVLVFKQMSNAISKSEERSNKLSLVMAKLAPIIRTIGDFFEVIVDVVLKYIDVVATAYSAITEFLGINPKGSADAFVAAEKSKQKAMIETRKLNEQSAEQSAIIAEQSEILADKQNYNYEQRVAALKKQGAAEQQYSANSQKIAELNLKMLEEEAALDDNNAAMNDKVSAAIVAVSNARKESAAVGRKVARERQKIAKEHEEDLKEEAAAEKALADSVIATRRRLIDSSFSIMEVGEKKSIAMATERHNRELEDLKRNGELSSALKKNMELAFFAEISKIKSENATSELTKSIKADELILANMTRAGDNTINFEKKLLNKRMELEIQGGADKFEVMDKYRYLELDLIAKTNEGKSKLFEAQLKNDTDKIKESADAQALEIKKSYAKGEISKEEHTKKLAKIQIDAQLKVNEKIIELLQIQLASATITEDKREEISNRIKKLQIDNEKEITDAIIAEIEERKVGAKDLEDSWVGTLTRYVDAATEILSALGDFQTQASENKIAEYEKEQEAHDLLFEARQETLDNAIMSDETRAERQKELDLAKAASDKAISDKIMAEKIKQAKWEKAQAIVSTIISTAMSIVKTGATLGYPVAIPFVVLAAIAGAIQVATIANKPLPAYEDGGITGEGLALWGEKRPEVAVSPSGDTFFADKPTVTHFDAGTRIYKNTDEYDKAMSQKGYSFDYDLMASKMPKNDIILDSRGLWGIVSKQKARSVLINRRHQI